MKDEKEKTILFTFDDSSRMKEFCANHAGIVTKDFMDWYVLEKRFFSESGVMIVDGFLEKEDQKMVFSFDLTNPEENKFVLFNPETYQEVSRFYFYPEDNLSMKDIWIKMNYFDKAACKKWNCKISEPKLNKKIIEVYNTFQLELKRCGGVRKKLLSIQNKYTEEVNIIRNQQVLFLSKQAVYMTYSAMYYFSKRKAEEVIGGLRQEISESFDDIKVKSLYKYTGYVNLSEAKIYKPIIKKEKSEPQRRYDRHIEKWSVRGHYRRVNGNLIWINSFEKGQGELENRVYGTPPESEVNLIPKVFEVERSVKANMEYSSDIKPTKEKIAKKETILQKIINFFKFFK
jgi:hypothetical protein